MTEQLPSFIQEHLSRIPLVGKTAIRVALVGFVREVFNFELGIEQFRKLTELLRKDPRIELVLGDEITENGILWAGELAKTQRVADHFVAKGVDVLLVVPINYGDEEGAAVLAKKVFNALGCPICTFVHPEVPINADGTRELDDGCGILPMRQFMRRMLKRTPGYIPSSAPVSPEFATGLTVMLKIASGMRSIRSVRGLQIGAAQQTFPAIEGDRQVLRDLFGLRVETMDAGAFRKVVQGDLESPPTWLGEIENWAYQWINTDDVIGEHPNVRKMTALALGNILGLLAEKESNTVSINCWPEVQEELGLMVCGVNALLYSLGIMAPCETDWPGALASALLQGLSIGETQKGCGFFADMTRFEKEKGSAMWWHCGPFSPQFARSGKCRQCAGWVFKGIKCAGLLDHDWGDIGQEVTFAQLRPDEKDQLTLIGTNGIITDGPPTIGSRFYTRIPKPTKFEAFMMGSPYDHHNSGWLGANYLDYLENVAYWLGNLPVALFSNI